MVQGVRNRGSISEVTVESAPFVAMVILMSAVLIIFPNLALVLSSLA